MSWLTVRKWCSVNNKHWIMLIVVGLLLIPMNLFIPDASASDGWVIDGDTVYYVDDYVNLSATPHTLFNSGWVEFGLETFSYDGDIDVVWGFDSLHCLPSSPQIWKNYTHELVGWHYVDRIGSIIIYNVSGWVNLGIENFDLYDVDYGNSNNTFLFNISYETNLTMIVAFSSYEEIGDGNDYRLTGHYDNYESYVYYETFYDWYTWDADFDTIMHPYGGMDLWFLLKELSIVHDVEYKVRAWMDIDINTNGKYWWALKPSDLSISEAIAADVFYCLDPWYDSNWTYCKKITIDHNYIDTDLVNFPVLFKNKSIDLLHAQGDGDDFLFVSSDNSTQYNHEIETFDNVTGTLVAWVNVTSVSADVDTVLYLYYGNSDCDSQEDVVGTWDSDYTAVYHYDDNTTSSVNDSTSSGYDGTKKGANEPVEANGHVYKEQVFDGTNDYIGNNLLSSRSDSNGTLNIWCRSDVNDTYVLHSVSNSGTNYYYLMFLFGKNYGISLRGPVDGTSNDIILNYGFEDFYDGDYHNYVLTCDSVTENNLYVDGSQVSWDSVSGTTNLWFDAVLSSPEYSTVGLLRRNSDYGPLDGDVDEVRFSKVERNSSWVNASFNTINSPSSFLSVGSEMGLVGGSGRGEVVLGPGTPGFGLMVLVVAVFVVVLVLYPWKTS